MSQRRFSSAIAAILTGVSLLTLVGCGSEPTPVATPEPVEESEPVSPETSATPAATPTPTTETETAATPPADTATVTVYKIDDRCEEFVPQQVAVAKDNAMEAAVGEVLQDWSNGDFDLAGYRVSYDENSATATVDLRVAPDSTRQIRSLSSCERYALFGGMKETLLQNPQWNIREVKFTSAGEEIYF